MEQVHSLCVDSRPGDRLRGPLFFIIHYSSSSVKLSLKLTARLSAMAVRKIRGTLPWPKTDLNSTSSNYWWE